MKNFFTEIFVACLVLTKVRGKFTRLTALLLCAFALSQTARAQVTPTTIFALTNLPAYIEAGGTSNVFQTNASGFPTNNVISVRQGTGMASQWQGAGTNAAASTGLAFNWAVSYDGTNFSTNSSSLITMTNVPNGNNNWVYGTNFLRQLTDNAIYVTPYSLINGSAAHGGVFVSNVVASFGNLVPGSGL
jgi:hypothetical protein